MTSWLLVGLLFCGLLGFQQTDFCSHIIEHGVGNVNSFTVLVHFIHAGGYCM